MSFIVLVAQILLCSFGVDFFLPSFPALASEFQASSASMQYLIGSYTLGTLLIRLVLGTLRNQFGLRNTMIFMGILGASGHCLAIFSGNLFSLLVSRVVQGVGLGGQFILAMTILPKLTKQRFRGYNIGFISFNAGLVTGPLMAAFLLERLGIHWRGLFSLSAFAQCALLPFFFSLKKEKAREKKPFFQSYQAILSSPRVVFNVLWGVFTVVQYLTYLSQIPHAITNTLGLSSRALSLVLFLSSISSIVFGLLWNRALKSMALPSAGYLALLLNGSLLVFSAILLVGPTSLSLFGVLSFIFLQNLTASLVLPLSLSQATGLLESEQTEIISFSSILRSFFTFLSTTICALLLTEFSLYFVFLITSVFSFLPAALLFRSKKRFSID